MIELYHFWDSFCSFKVRFCLEEKGLAWTGRHVDLMRFENFDPAYLAVNPAGLVPTLVVDGRRIPESSIINEYLDEAYPDPPLCPVDPFARAEMRLWIRVEEDELFRAIRPASLNLMMKPVFAASSDDELDRRLARHPRPGARALLKKMFREPFDAAAVEKSRRELRVTFERMDARLASAAWLAGSAYSLADIAAAPVIDRLERLGLAGVWAGLAQIERWVARLRARPAYARALPCDQFRMPRPRPEDLARLK